MDWIVKCRCVKDKDTNKFKNEIIRICPKCKDKQKIDVTQMYAYQCPACGQIMERPKMVYDDKNDDYKPYKED